MGNDDCAGAAGPGWRRSRRSPARPTFELEWTEAYHAARGRHGTSAEPTSNRDCRSSRVDLLIVLFPQGSHHDATVRDTLREQGLRIPFVYDHYSEAYTRSLVSQDAKLPVAQLATTEGRLLFESRIDAQLATKIERVHDAS